MPWDGNKRGTLDESSRAEDTVYTDADKLEAGAECSLRDVGEAFQKTGKRTAVGRSH